MPERISYQQICDDAEEIFHNGFACSESVIWALRKNFAWTQLSDDAIAMGSGFPWGLGGVGCLCGAVAGGSMCLGYVFGRREPGDPRGPECQKLTREFAEAVRREYGACCCGSLIADFADRNAPERKAKCTEIVRFCAWTAAAIIAREEKIKAE